MPVACNIAESLQERPKERVTVQIGAYEVEFAKEYTPTLEGVVVPEVACVRDYAEQQLKNEGDPSLRRSDFSAICSGCPDHPSIRISAIRLSR